MTVHALATTLGDRDGELISKIERFLPSIVSRFGVVAVQALAETHPEVISRLRESGAVISTEPRNIDQIGAHRRQALKMALTHGGDTRILYIDFDHLLRWMENDPSEFDRILVEASEYDCTVIGRGQCSLAALPERLALTEEIVNRVFYLTTQRPWDVMMAARSLSRSAASAIVEGCSVDSIGNDVAWPLYCLNLGLSVGYVEAEGLTYRTNKDYAEDLADSQDSDPRAWATRICLAAQHMEAMMPYIDEEQQRRSNSKRQK